MLDQTSCLCCLLLSEVSSFNEVRLQKMTDNASLAALRISGHPVRPDASSGRHRWARSLGRRLLPPSSLSCHTHQEVPQSTSTN